MIMVENLPVRFKKLIDCSIIGTGCWLWNGRLNDDGYGITSINDRSMGAHRATTLLLTGDVGPELDHLCRTRRCVNPLHLESISHRENVLRGEGIAAKYARRNHCKHGHEFTSANTHMYGNSRVCLTCKKQKNEESFVRINGPRTGKSGAFNGRAKITEVDIPNIRADSRSQSVIASAYGITQTTVSAIKLRKLWAHIS